MVEIRYDLHSHTNLSDGHLTPEALVLRAVEKKVDVLAITDHDTTAALAPAQNTIATLNLPLQLIHGIEISTNWHGFDIHIVGLNIDANHPMLVELVNQQACQRRKRAYLIAERLEQLGFDHIYEHVEATVGKEVAISRSHFARYLVNIGAARNMNSAFTKYLGKGKRAYVSPQWCSIETAVETIHNTGGQAVLAHPGRYDMSGKKLRLLLQDFVNAGGDAMEVASGQQPPDQRQYLAALAKDFSLLASAGSDFHNPCSWGELGYNLHLPATVIPIWSTWHEAV